MVHKCPYLKTGFNGEYRCEGEKDSGGYYSNTYLGDSPDKFCTGGYLQCETFKKKYNKGVKS